MPDAVIYPPTITTDKDKLLACYSLRRQMREEHNIKAADFRSRLELEPVPVDEKGLDAKRKSGFIRPWCPEGYMLADTQENNSLRARFKSYAQQSRELRKQLLAEQNRLKDKIKWDTYTPEQWKQISKLAIDEPQTSIERALWGDRASEEVKSTQATSHLLDELKALSLDELSPKPAEDPIEDFTTYDETDEGDEVTKDSDSVDWVELTQDHTAHVSDSKGSAHFDSDYSHRFECKVTAMGAINSMCYFWALANAQGCLRALCIADEDIQEVFIINDASDRYFYLREWNGGIYDDDSVEGILLNTAYFHEVYRDEGVGTYGTIYDDVATDDYYSDGGSLVTGGDLSLALTEKQDFEYVYGLSGHDQGNASRYTSGYTKNLDLQELQQTAYPQTIGTQSVSPEDDNDWANPSNIGADDAAYASVTSPTFDTDDITYRLKAQNFGFTIPEGAVIDGIKVEIERYNDAGETAKDYRVQLLDANGSLVGDNKADTVNDWPTTPTIKSYGGATDTWNASPTRAMVNDADFGVVLSAQATANNADIYVDFIRITVYYTLVTIYNLSVTDGLKLGDDPSQNMVAGVSVTDGFKAGDSASELGQFAASLTDGVNLGDSALIKAILSFLDGFKLGDSPSEDMTAAPSVTDGVKFGDTPLSELFSDLEITDGVKLGDTPLAAMLANVELSDGAKFGDVTLAQLVEAIYLYLTDGLKVGDTPLASMVANLHAADGLKLGDSATLSLLRRLLIITAITSQYRQVHPITTQYRKVNPFTSLYRKIRALISGG